MSENGNPRVTEAAKWLATTPDHLKPHPLIPELKKRLRSLPSPQPSL